MLYLLTYINEFRSFTYLFEIKSSSNMDNNTSSKHKTTFSTDCVGLNDYSNFFANSFDTASRSTICLLNSEIGIFKNGYKPNG